MKVFISSVISGMEEFRDAAARAIRSLGHQVIRAEDFHARADSPQVACLAGVREAEAVVLLMGGRYGAVQSSGLSATQEEYREARERCPVMVIVQNDVDREHAQTQFLNEVRDWAHGHYTKSFTDADELRDAVVGALHSMELARATGPVDSDEILQRAIELLPTDERRDHAGHAQLALTLAGGPLQTVLRPAQLEAQELQENLQRIALFGDAAVLTTREGTETAIDNDALVFSQPNCSVAINETGALRLLASIPAPERGLAVIIEEDVRGIIRRFLLFANAALTHVDPVERLSHIVVAARLLGEHHLAWRTRAEHDRSPDRVTINWSGGGERSAVHLSPPHRTRSALRHTVDELVDDLTVKLRRQLQDQKRGNPW